MERRGGRQRGTPNKKTLLRNAEIEAISGKPDLTPLDLLPRMRSQHFPLTTRVQAALKALPRLHAKRSADDVDEATFGVERELVLRLASLLWRLRRATTMETGLFEIQADYLREFGQGHQVNPASREVVHTLFRRAEPVSFDSASHSITNGTETVDNPGPNSIEPAVDPTADLARCFLRLANLPNFALDHLSRYEVTLWRQVAQILFALDAFRSP